MDGSNNTISEFSVVADSGQAGARARGGFTFQDCCAALAVIEGLMSGELEAIDVELATDLVIYTIDQRPELVSIKSRDPMRGTDQGWSKTALREENVLGDLYRRWKQNNGNAVVCFWSNAGPTNEMSSLRKPPNQRDPSLAKNVAALIDAPEREVESFLQDFVMRCDDIPTSTHIHDVVVRRMEELLKKWGRPMASAEFAVSALVERIKQASEQSLTAIPHASGHDAEKARDSDLRHLRHLGADELKDLIIEAATRVSELRIHPVKNLAHDTLFVGRSAELEKLHQWYETCDSVALISGPVGAGKTSLAREFAADVGEDLFWMDASTPTACADTWELINEISPKGLVIVDGIRSPEDLLRFTGRPWKSRLLITSVPVDPQVRWSVKIDEWSEKEAIIFLQGRVPGDGQQIVKALGGNALVLSQVVATCLIENLSLDEYWNQFESSLTEALNIGAVGDPAYAMGSAIAAEKTLGIALNLLLHVLEEHSPQALYALRILSCFAPGLVTRSRLRPHVITSIGQGDPLSEDDSDIIQQTINMIKQPSAMVQDLIRWSLLQPIGDSLLAHPSQQIIVRDGMEDPRPYLRYAIGSFLTEDGGIDLSFGEGSQAANVVEFALDRGFTGFAVHALALRTAFMILPASPIRAKKLAQMTWDWLKDVDGRIDEGIWLEEATRYLELLLLTNEEQFINQAAQLLPGLMMRSWNLGIGFLYSRQVRFLSALSATALHSDLIPLLKRSLPAEDLNDIDLPMAADFSLAAAKLAWLEGDPKKAEKILMDLLNRINQENNDAGENQWSEFTELARHELVALASTGIGVGADRLEMALAEVHQLEEQFGESVQGAPKYVGALLQVADVCLTILGEGGNTDIELLTIADDQLKTVWQCLHQFQANNRFYEADATAIQGRLFLHKALSDDSGETGQRALVQARRFLQDAVQQGEELDQFPWLSSAYFNLAQCAAAMGDMVAALDAAYEARRCDVQRFGEKHFEVQRDDELIRSIQFMELLQAT